MLLIKTIVPLLTAASIATAAISGKVTDTSGAALPGALVSLEKNGASDTAEADGSFSLTVTVGTGGGSLHPPRRNLRVTIKNGMPWVTVAERSVVEIAAFDLCGKALATTRWLLDRGSHAVPPTHGNAGVYLYRIKAGNDAFLLRGAVIDGTFRGTVNAGKDSPAHGAVIAADLKIDDVIAVTKAGYLRYREIVTNPDTGGIEIRIIVCADTVTDADGNVYQAVKIGNQLWTVENLRTTKYNDGSSIPPVTAASAWSVLTTPAYCFYNNTNSADSMKNYGALYNWYAVNTKKLAPSGWHVPTDLEWETLQNYLIANKYNWDGTTSPTPWNKLAKSLSAKTDWQSDTTAGAIGNDVRKNNRSGFSALPSGCRMTSGYFYYLGENCSWWTTSEYDPPYAWNRYLSFNIERLDRGYSKEHSGFSVRIVKD